ncbi:MAG: hypothetical protein AAFZ87_19965 [Planctomycetota bacterium]
MPSPVLLKFGGSILHGPDDVARAARCVQAELARGARVVAVTSAFRGRTDALEASLVQLGEESGRPPTPHERAALLATGELETIRLLLAELEAAGVRAALADVREVGPFVEPGTERPTRLDAARLLALFELADVVCLPGFVAAEDTTDAGPALLGRGGSDMTALFAGHALGARVKLVKDVEGLFATDPSMAPIAGAHRSEEPEPLATLDFDAALELGPTVLQPAAVRFARSIGFGFEVVGPEHFETDGAARPGTSVGGRRAAGSTPTE